MYIMQEDEGGTLLSQEELNAKKDADKAYEDTWVDRRRARVQGDDAYKTKEPEGKTKEIDVKDVVASSCSLFSM